MLELLNVALAEGIYLYTWLKGTANRIPTGPRGRGRTRNTINQNFLTFRIRIKTMHEPESKKGFMKVLNYFLTWAVQKSSSLE